MTLQLKSFGIAFGDQVVVAKADLVFPTGGPLVLVGSAGAGKSTLIRTLAGLNDAQPSLRVWGDASLDGRPVGSGNRAELVYQNARLLGVSLRENLVSALPDRASLTMQQQDDAIEALLTSLELSHLQPHIDSNVAFLSTADKRSVAIARLLLRGPKLLMIDEPTATLKDDEAHSILDLLKTVAKNLQTLIVTHNRKHALELGGSTALLAGGKLFPSETTAAFFARDGDDPQGRYARTGRCDLPAPNADPDSLSPEAPEPVRIDLPLVPSHTLGPRGFYWLVPGKIGGCPRPGVVLDLAVDVEALQRLGATRVVNLEEEIYYDPDVFQNAGIEVCHFPIVDMKTPTFDAARSFCTEILRRADDGDVVVAHCRAGLGRTGLLMALLSITAGHTASEAFDHVRGINPKWIQSDEQIDFLPAFEQDLAAQEQERAPG